MQRRLSALLVILVFVGGGCAPLARHHAAKYTPPKTLDKLLHESAQVESTFDNDSALLTNSNTVSVDAPLQLKNPVVVSTHGIPLGIKLEDSTAEARVIAPAVALYENSLKSTNTAVQALGDRGVRFITILKDAAAPSSFNYSLSLPDGVSVVNRADGVAFVTPNNHDLLVIARPWAVDASHKRLESFYSVSGTTLTLHVDQAGATYPIISDPWFIPLVESIGIEIVKELAVWAAEKFVIDPAACALTHCRSHEQATPTSAVAQTIAPPATSPAASALVPATSLVPTTSAVTTNPPTTPTTHPAALPYTADWSSGMQGWQNVQNGDWTTAGGSLVSRGTTYGTAIIALAPVRLDGYPNYAVDTDILLDSYGDAGSISGLASFGIVVASTGKQDGYGFGHCTAVGIFSCAADQSSQWLAIIQTAPLSGRGSRELFTADYRR